MSSAGSVGRLGVVAAVALAMVGPSRALAQREDTVVKVAGAPRYAGNATLVEEVSFGTADGPDEQVFGDVSGIAIGHDGAMYVLDRQSRVVRMFDVNGKFVRTIGRGGHGPGEIQVASAIAVHPDGRLLLWDTQNWRINVYSPAGANVTQWPMAGRGVSLIQHGLTVDTAGRVYAQRLFPSPPEVQPRAFWHMWERLNGRTGASIDTVRAPHRWPPRPAGLSARNPGGGEAKVSMPFTAEPVSRMSPLGYLVTGVGNTYAFELRPAAGPIVSIRRDIPREAVPQRERAAERKRVEDFLRRADPSWSWGNRDVPTVKPYYVDMLVGLDGRVWVQRDKRSAFAQPGNNGSGGIGGVPAGRERTAPATGSTGGSAARTRLATRFDVFEPSGAFVGQVTAPPGVVPIVTRGDHVWALVLDDDDVPMVKRYRVAWR